MITPLSLAAALALCAAAPALAQPAFGATVIEVRASRHPTSQRTEPEPCDPGCLLEDAGRAAASRDWRRAVELYETVLRGHAVSGEHWLAFGEALYQDGRHREAIAAYERAMQLGAAEPWRPALDVARAYAHLGNRRQALRWIERSVALGLVDRELLRAEPEFRCYGDDARFEALIGSVTPSRFPSARAM